MRDSEPNVNNLPETKPFELHGHAQHNPDLPDSFKFLVRENGGIVEAPLRARLVIGRRSSNMHVDVDLSDFDAQELGVSRQHCAIEVEVNRVLVRDLNSVNGTRLNGSVLRPDESYEINHCDELKLGRMHLRVYFIGQRFEIFV